MLELHDKTTAAPDLLDMRDNGGTTDEPTAAERDNLLRNAARDFDHMTDQILEELEPVVPLTEDQARADYADRKMRGDQTTVRDIAAAWGLSKSTAGRLIAKFKAERAASRGIISPALAVAGPKFKAKEEDDPFAPANPDLLLHAQPATACYLNVYGQIVIRQESNDGFDEDPVVRFEPVHIPLLIARLKQLEEEAKG